MQLARFFVVVILVFLPATGLSEDFICEGEYKDRQPNKAALDKILKDHSTWLESKDENDKRRANLCNANLRLADLRGADLSGADLRGVDLSRADLTGAYLIVADLSGANLMRADLRGANLRGADLSRTNLFEADLSRANLTSTNLSEADLFWADLIEAYLGGAILMNAYLSNADLSGANLRLADLSGAILGNVDLSGANLSGADLSEANLFHAKLKKAQLINTKLLDAKFTDVDLNKAYYEPISVPDKAFLSGIQNLKTVSFENGKQSGLVLLKNSLKESGLRELEREATYAIEKGITDNLFWFEQFIRRLLFEWTAGYGLYPGRCLIILLSLIPAFTLIYLFPIYSRKESLGQHKSGVYKIWINDRIRKDLGSDEPKLITAGFWKGIGYAFYFSIVSAFHIGWRDVNVGTWIARIQPREYTLGSAGWVRSVSGIQSLISIYLLAFWVLTQFGRPFG